ncbi:MAG: hypothetical protein QOG05_6066 [Streptosporangiaceae bacterium]|jgi:hypothetical protein|nr:hypothetical protein [Streptosporangiaceae bacterium]
MPIPDRIERTIELAQPPARFAWTWRIHGLAELAGYLDAAA